MAAVLQTADRRFESFTGYCDDIGYTITMPMATPEEQRKYQREWLQARRQAWLAENGPCIDCGSWDNLEVDHVNALEKASHRVWSWSEERRLAELAKCVVRCHPCHREKTISMNETACGEKNGWALLSEVDIPVIRASTESRRALAERYQVSPETIKTVRARRSWKYVELFMVGIVQGQNDRLWICISQFNSGYSPHMLSINPGRSAGRPHGPIAQWTERQFPELGVGRSSRPGIAGPISESWTRKCKSTSWGIG